MIVTSNPLLETSASGKTSVISDKMLLSVENGGDAWRLRWLAFCWGCKCLSWIVIVESRCCECIDGSRSVQMDAKR